MSNGRTACFAVADDWLINILRAISAVLHIAFALQCRKQSADGGITRRIRHAVHHLRCGGVLSAVKNVHDLPFSSRKRQWLWFCWHAPQTITGARAGSKKKCVKR